MLFGWYAPCFTEPKPSVCGSGHFLMIHTAVPDNTSLVPFFCYELLTMYISFMFLYVRQIVLRIYSDRPHTQKTDKTHTKTDKTRKQLLGMTGPLLNQNH